MSLEEVERTIKLDQSHPFNHRQILKEEISRFKNAFERNENFLEFERLINKDHKIYEANETPVLKYLQTEEIKSVTNELIKTSERLRNLSKPLLKKNALRHVNLLKLSQVDIYKIAIEEMKKSHEALDKIIETD